MAGGLLLIVVGVAVLVAGYRIYQVSGSSMAQTLRPGERIVGESVSGRSIRRGDIVIFAAAAWATAGSTAASGEVKRVIAVGGDTVTCCAANGRLRLRTAGSPAYDELRENYLPPGVAASDASFSATIPAGHLFLLGDNRPISVDSRSHAAAGADGSLPLSAVRARVVAIAYPFGRSGAVGSTRAAPASFTWALRAVVVGGLLVLAVVLAGLVAGAVGAARRPRSAG